MGQMKALAMDISIAIGHEGDLTSPAVKYALARFDMWIRAGVKPQEAVDRAITSGKIANKYLRISNKLVEDIREIEQEFMTELDLAEGVA